MSSITTAIRHVIENVPSLLPTTNYDRLQDTWHQSFNTQVITQDVSDVLDENNISTTSDCKAEVLYAVLESKILFDRGKAIKCDHEHVFKSQKVCQRIYNLGAL